MNDKIESGQQSIELTKLMVEFSNALASTAEALDCAFATRPELKERPVVYQIPRMSVSVKVSMSMSQGKIRSAFGLYKDKSDRSEEMVSTINMDFVAVPRSSQLVAWRDLSYTTPTTKGDDVRLLQQKLERYGQDHDRGLVVGVDGEFGTETRDAVIRFQNSRYPTAPEKGTVDIETYNALLKFAPDPSPAYTKVVENVDAG